MTIAISAATGQLGRLVIDKLKAKVAGSDIVALARSPGKAGDLGVAVREADYSKPETLRSALSGVDTLLLISSSEIGQRATQHRNVIEAAKQAGVKHIVYTSVLHADTSPLSLAAEHTATEADLKASGIPFTILRNGWYTENYTGSVKGALAGGAFIGSAGDGKISSAPRADYADAAVGPRRGNIQPDRQADPLQESARGGLCRRARRIRAAAAFRHSDRELGRRRFQRCALRQRPRALRVDRPPDRLARHIGGRRARIEPGRGAVGRTAAASGKKSAAGSRFRFATSRRHAMGTQSRERP